MRNNGTKGRILLFAIPIIIIFSQLSYGRAALDSEPARKPNYSSKVGADSDPYPTLAAHTIGEIGLTVTNKGQFGTGFFTGDDAQDPVTGEIAPSCVYPYPGTSNYLFSGSFWIGSIVGRDTLVSVGADGWTYVQEMWPDPYPDGDIERHSIADPTDVVAISEQDFIAMYTDTISSTRYVSQDNFDGRPHVPLNIEVTQRSYAWSYSYADDFVLFDYSVKNIGRKTLNNVYMGFYVDGDAGSTNTSSNWDEAQDDVCGFRRTIESQQGCEFLDTINIAWISDNNGLNESSQDECPWGHSSPTSDTGMRVVRTPSDSLKYSFNWWISNVEAAKDFGPRKAGTPEDPFRDFGGFLGTPMGDKNKYYILSHEEFDYDQLFTNRDNTPDGWLGRPPQAADFADGYDTRYLLSFGPFNIYPGEVLPITFAYVAGKDFFMGECLPPNEAQSMIRNTPEEYYMRLNFREFGQNAVWASWIYDNPGVDTDLDGDSGKSRICVFDSLLVDSNWVVTGADTFYYEGDDVPDFRGASPPPPPELWVINNYPIGDTIRALISPEVDDMNRGSIRIRWYGYRSELTRDVFSGLEDFEGYRVYRGLTATPNDFVLIASYDLVDFNKYVYNSAKNEYELKDAPYTLEKLRDAYGPDFDPYEWTISNPFIRISTNPQVGDSAFYFRAQDWNQANLTDTFEIHKLYPEQPFPSSLDHDSAAIYYPDELTEYGYFKYFMYEYVMRDLLPSQKYYFAVTAFDFGSPVSNLASLETPPIRNYIAEYPQNRNSVVAEKGLEVVVYPNPYRADANYYEDGFEGRGMSNIPRFRQHRIHFTNLPPKCTIRIFTIDGDLIREIKHDCIEDSPGCMHEEWDMITRNTQAVVSGIYYYSVESEQGNQIGKLVIIM